MDIVYVGGVLLISLLGLPNINGIFSLPKNSTSACIGIDCSNGGLVDHQTCTCKCKGNFFGPFCQKVFQISMWPKGSYSIPASMFGCPEPFDHGWRMGYVNMTTAETTKQIQQWPESLRLLGPYHKQTFQLTVCTKIGDDPEAGEDIYWPDGSYCIIKTFGHRCPTAFDEKHLPLRNYVISNNDTGGWIPSYDVNNEKGVTFHLCCKNASQPNHLMILPTKMQFYLLQPDNGTRCSEIEGMEQIAERYDFIKLTPDLWTSNEIDLTVPETDSFYNLTFCHYKPTAIRKCIFKEDKGSSYRGTIDHIITGETCYSWKNISFVNSKNYVGAFTDNHCRRFMDFHSGPICSTPVGWGLCPIDTCDTSGEPNNVALHRPVDSAPERDDFYAYYAVDGNLGKPNAILQRPRTEAWLQVDLQSDFEVHSVTIYKENTYVPYNARAVVAFAGLRKWDHFSNGAHICDGPHNLFRVNIFRFQCHQPIISRYITIVNTVRFHPSRSSNRHYMLELSEVVVRAKDTGCGRPLGIASGSVQDFQITASSIVGTEYAYNGRLNSETGWCAWRSDKQPYIQVDLITAMEIQGVIIQGWVENRDDIIPKSFSISYGVTEDSLVLYEDNNKTVFEVNTLLAPEKPQTFRFSYSAVARIVRISIIDYGVKPCLKFELIGCPKRVEFDLTCHPSSEFIGWQELYGHDFYMDHVGENSTQILPNVGDCKDACINWHLRCRSAVYKDTTQRCKLLLGDRYSRHYVQWWIRKVGASTYLQGMCLRDVKPMIECGGNITSLGELYSPGYPFYYGESIDCTWIIHLPEGQYIQIDLLDVDLAVAETNAQIGGDKAKLADSFTVYDRNVREPKIFQTSGGTLKINPVTRLISTSNTLEINLKSTYRFSETGARGFAINISKSDCAGCGVGEVSCSAGAKCMSSCGYISSRNFPDFYDVSSSCSWKIQGVMGQYVVATFLQLDVIGNEKCEGDFVNLYDLGLNDNRIFLGKYCKHHRPVYSINSNGHKMEVELYSDFSVVGSGFMLKYELRTITLQTTTQNSTGCDLGWRGFENSCYRFDVSNKPITWTSASSLCTKQGGHLVSINGIREMEFLHSTILLHSPFSTRSAYIGLKKIQNGTFQWVDGKPLSYSAWYEDETGGRRQPDGFDQELCSFMTIASIRSLKSWHDVACAYNQLDQFICEKNKAIHEYNLILKRDDMLQPSDVYHQCSSSGEFIPSVYKCDEHTDCVDGSDEANCGDDCDSTMFRCDNGKCINMAFYCDFKFDCSDMSDEKNCVRRPCYEGLEWTCSSRECIPFQQRCNLESDCKDGSDERNCDECQDSAFQCYDGGCISKTRVCDGYVDCMGLYGEDEGPTCTRKSQTSCGSWNALGVTENGKYQLHINNETFEVECIFNDDKVKTIFHHDMEDLKYVGYTDLIQNIQYSASLATIAVFKDEVLQCRQHLEIGCHQLTWAYSKGDYWHDIYGQKQYFESDWNDKDVCSCILTDSCTQNITTCNCDLESSTWFSMDDNAWMKDHGYIDDTDVLPMTRVKMVSVRVLQGLTIHIGPLECEEATHMKNNFLLCDSGIVVPATAKCILDYDIFGVETGCRDLSHLIGCVNFECPLDHVKCPESYCLPIRNVCNGKADCPNKEDEYNCEDWSCDGYFKCRETTICLPWKEVCDGIKHCPEGDDELLCDNICPPRCTCDGLIVKCTKFDKDTLSVLNTNTTYLDLKNAHFSEDVNFQSLRNLGYLDLSFTNIKNISKEMFKNLYNLLHLNLGYNSITKLGKHTFYNLNNLRFLNLLGNKGLAVIEPLTFEGLSNLKVLDLSGMSLETIVFDTFSGLSAVTSLNLSGNGIYSIEDRAFNSLGGLSMLDLQRNDIGQFSGLIFGGLSNLTYLYTDRYTFCCLKPTSVLSENCLPEPDEFSSCSDLMKNETLRTSMWFLGLIALAGNLFVLLYRAVCDSTGFKRSNGIMVANLSLADFFMGIYMLIIASADVLYRGTYSWNDIWWRNSYVCKLAGFIATFSSEASVMFLCLITFDRVIAIKFPFSKLKITKKSAAVYVSAVWILSLCFAFCPLIATSYFKDQFFSRTGVCLGLPLTRDRSPGWEYGVGIFIVWNFICFVVIALGQGLIYHEIRQSSQRLQFQRKSDMTVARKLSFIVMSDFICWFPICVLGLMALRGYVIPGEVYAWTAVFILPINSALNPIIYTASSIQMKQVVRKLTNRDNTRSKSMKYSTETTEILKGVHDIRSSELFRIDPPRDAVHLTDYLHSNTDLSMFLEITIKIATSINTLHKNGFVLGELSESQLFVYVHNGKVQRLCSSILPIQSCDYDELQHDIKMFGILVSKILKAYTVGKKKLAYGI